MNNHRGRNGDKDRSTTNWKTKQSPYFSVLNLFIAVVVPLYNARPVHWTKTGDCSQSDIEGRSLSLKTSDRTSLYWREEGVDRPSESHPVLYHSHWFPFFPAVLRELLWFLKYQLGWGRDWKIPAPTGSSRAWCNWVRYAPQGLRRCILCASFCEFTVNVALYPPFPSNSTWLFYCIKTSMSVEFEISINELFLHSF